MMLQIPGTRVGRFEIMAELGRGGMALVYQARQIDLDRIVALKVLSPALVQDTVYVDRFRQEARRAANLEHPHIVPIYDIGEAEQLYYIAMQYIPGETLKDILERQGSLSVQQALAILTPVAQALSYAHRRGVIHRDIKPSNIMISNESWVYLTDFGLARDVNGAPGLTRTGMVMGTPEYMSPEQAQGLPDIGPSADVYALGVVLYEVLSGAFPFQADTPLAILAARLVQEPRPLREMRADVSPAVAEVVMQALARDPAARFSTADELIAALHQAVEGTVITPSQPAVVLADPDHSQMEAAVEPVKLAAPLPPVRPVHIGATIALGRDPQQPAAQATNQQCAACATWNPVGAIFCVNCGRSLIDEAYRRETAAYAAKAPVGAATETSPPPTSAPTRMPEPMTPMPSPAVPQSKSRRKHAHPCGLGPVVWNGMGSGFFLIGLAILFLTRTIWPGIFILIGLSGFFSSAAANRPWSGVSTAVFFIGMAIIAALNAWWPGMLILIGITAILSATRHPDRCGW